MSNLWFPSMCIYYTHLCIYLLEISFTFWFIWCNNKNNRSGISYDILKVNFVVQLILDGDLYTQGRWIWLNNLWKKINSDGHRWYKVRVASLFGNRLVWGRPWLGMGTKEFTEINNKKHSRMSLCYCFPLEHPIVCKLL